MAKANDKYFLNMATGGFGTEAAKQTDSGLKDKVGGAAYLITGEHAQVPAHCLHPCCAYPVYNGLVTDNACAFCCGLLADSACAKLLVSLHCQKQLDDGLDHQAKNNPRFWPAAWLAAVAQV